MSLINLRAHCRPSALMRRHLTHQGDVSEADAAKVFATRTIHGRRVRFFSDGSHLVDGLDITEAEQYESEILRFAHASILAGVSVGDKNLVYVDASVDPVDVWIYGQRLADFIDYSRRTISTGSLTPDQIVYDDSLHTIQQIREDYHERDERLSRGRDREAYFSDWFVYQTDSVSFRPTDDSGG